MRQMVRLTVEASAALDRLHARLAAKYPGEGLHTPLPGMTVEYGLKLADLTLSGELERQITEKVLHQMEDRLNKLYAARAVDVIREALEDLHPEEPIHVAVDETTCEVRVGLANGSPRIYDLHPNAGSQIN